MRPWAEKVKAAQQDLQHYNDRFDSFKQQADALAALDGRGNSPSAAAQAEKLTHKVVELVEAPVWAGSQADDYFHIAAKLRKDAGL